MSDALDVSNDSNVLNISNPANTGGDTDPNSIGPEGSTRVTVITSDNPNYDNFGPGNILFENEDGATWVNLCFPYDFGISSHTEPDGSGTWFPTLAFEGNSIQLSVDGNAAEVGGVVLSAGGSRRFVFGAHDAPTASSDPGTFGEVAFDADYMYYHIGSEWRRTPLQAF